MCLQKKTGPICRCRTPMGLRTGGPPLAGEAPELWLAAAGEVWRHHPVLAWRSPAPQSVHIPWLLVEPGHGLQKYVGHVPVSLPSAPLPPEPPALSLALGWAQGTPHQPRLIPRSARRHRDAALPSRLCCTRGYRQCWGSAGSAPCTSPGTSEPEGHFKVPVSTLKLHSVCAPLECSDFPKGLMPSNISILLWVLLLLLPFHLAGDVAEPWALALLYPPSQKPPESSPAREAP